MSDKNLTLPFTGKVSSRLDFSPSITKISLSQKNRRTNLALQGEVGDFSGNFSDILNTEEIETTLINPDNIIEIQEYIYHYYKYFKHKNTKAKYLKVIVKYLNQHGFVVTAYYVTNM